MNRRKIPERYLGRAIAGAVLLGACGGLERKFETIPADCPATTIVREPEQRKPIIYVIGMSHDNEFSPKENSDNLLRKELIEKACNGKIVLGLEGIERNPQIEKAFFGEDSYVFGVEDQFAFAYSIALDGFGFASVDRDSVWAEPNDALADPFEVAYTSKVIGKIRNLCFNRTLRRSWKRVGKLDLPETTRSLYDKIDTFVRVPRIPLRKEVFNFMVEAGRDADWAGVYKSLLIDLNAEAATLPADERPDTELVGSFIKYSPNDPHFGETFTTLRGSVIIDWRDRQSMENYRQIITFAAKKGLDVYLPKGESHVDLPEMLRREYPYLTIVSFGTAADFSENRN